MPPSPLLHAGSECTRKRAPLIAHEVPACADNATPWQVRKAFRLKAARRALIRQLEAKGRGPAHVKCYWREREWHCREEFSPDRMIARTGAPQGLVHDLLGFLIRYMLSVGIHFRKILFQLVCHFVPTLVGKGGR